MTAQEQPTPTKDDDLTVDTPQPQPKRRWLKVLAGFFALVVLLLGSVVWMMQSERGSVALFRVVKTLTAGKVDVQWRSGSLADGGAASSVNVHLSSTQIDIKNLSGTWRWDYVPIHWRVSSLSADEVNITLLPKPDSNTPTADVVLPFAITADRVQVNTVQIISTTSTTVMSQIDGSVATDKRNHAINLTRMVQGSAEYNG